MAAPLPLFFSWRSQTQENFGSAFLRFERRPEACDRFGRAVGRAVVHHDHLDRSSSGDSPSTLEPREACLDQKLLVVGGNDYRESRARPLLFQVLPTGAPRATSSCAPRHLRRCAARFVAETAVHRC